MKWVKRILLALLVLFVVAQLIRPSMANPPFDETKTLYAAEPVPSDVRAMLDRSCADCHSSRTAWPWYSRIAPVSWFLIDHVKDGRKELNYDEWVGYTPRRQARKLEETCDQVKTWEMPLKSYLRLHRDADLTQEEREQLCRWSTAYRARIIAAHPEAARRGQPSQTR
jgi:hypothetical protein